MKPAVYFHDADPMARRERWSRVSGGDITGSLSWQDYTYRVRVLPTDLNGVGIIFGWRDPENYYLFRWGANAGTAPGVGRQQIIRVAEGKRVVVADARGGYQPKRAYVIETAFRPGYAAVLIDGLRVLETADPYLTHGAVGVTPLDSRVKEVTVILREEPPPPEEEITKEFTDSAAHPDMAEWANPARAWVLRAGPKGPVFWRKGDYFGDVSVELTLPKHDPSQTLAFLAARREGSTERLHHRRANPRARQWHCSSYDRRPRARGRRDRWNCARHDALPGALLHRQLPDRRLGWQAHPEIRGSNPFAATASGSMSLASRWTFATCRCVLGTSRLHVP